MSIKATVLNLFNKNFPEYSELKDGIKFTLVIIVIDVMLIPMYINWPTLYFISLLVHIRMYGGFSKIITAALTEIERRLLELGISTREENNDSYDE